MENNELWNEWGRENVKTIECGWSAGFELATTAWQLAWAAVRYAWPTRSLWKSAFCTSMTFLFGFYVKCFSILVCWALFRLSLNGNFIRKLRDFPSKCEVKAVRGNIVLIVGRIQAYYHFFFIANKYRHCFRYNCHRFGTQIRIKNWPS